MNLVILGPQGCGKGTQAKLLAQKLGLVHISSGELLRDEAASGTAKGLLIADLLAKGELVPFDTVLEVLEPALSSNTNGFVLDGTPRDLSQAEHLDWYLQKLSKQIDKVIFLVITREESVKRLLKRSTLENRSDDTLAGINRRLDLYHTVTAPVVNFYKDKGLLLEIDGSPDIETIHQDIMEKLSSLRGGTPTRQSIQS